MKRIIAALLIGGLLAVGCSDATTNVNGEVPQVSQPTIPDGLPLADDDATMPSGMGPGISVAEALASTLDQPLLINGYVFVYSDGSVVVADLIAESFPPQPGGAQVTVEGLDVMEIPLTEGPADAGSAITAWTETPVQLIGEIADGILVASSVASS